ncbi:MAG: AraC family transcriptional regulator [Novosphingobium sp.]
MHDALLQKLRKQHARHWQRFGCEPPLEGLTLMMADRPSDLMRSVYRTSFCGVLQGAKVSFLGERAFRYDAGKCLIASIDLPVAAQIVEASQDRPYMAFSLAIDPAMIADLLLGEAPEPLSDTTLPPIAVTDMRGAAARVRPRRARRNEPRQLPPAFPRGNHDDADPVPETDPPADRSAYAA